MTIRIALLFAAAFILAGCTPHPDTARRALLDAGLGQIWIGEPTLLCAPKPGVRFTAVDARGSLVTGRVCCFRFECEIAEDMAR